MSDRAHRRYSEELKQRIVADVEAGHLSLREAARDTQANVSMIQKWLDEYGRYKPKRDVVEVVMKSEQERIAALEQALAESHLKLRVYESLIAEANRHYKTDLKKSFGTPSSAPVVRTPPKASDSPSPPSAPSSSARATPTTNASDAPAPARRNRRGRR